MAKTTAKKSTNKGVDAVCAAELTDVGQLREENQDHCRSGAVGKVLIYTVCDGMGGHAGGRQASQLAVETLFQRFKKSRKRDLSARLVAAIEEANTAVWEASISQPSLRGMGTTCVTLMVQIESKTAWIAHVGDSRCYRSRGSQLQLMTRDHTVVQRMLDDGLLTREQAEHHPHSNVIARSLGGEETVDVEISDPIDLVDGDMYLLCSDGLTNMVPEREIALLLWGSPVEQIASDLVNQANAAGGTDNITVSLFQIGDRVDRPPEFEFLHPARKPSPELESMMSRDTRRAEAMTTPVPAVSGESEALPDEGPDLSETKREPSGELTRIPGPAPVILTSLLLAFLLGLAFLIVLWIAKGSA